MTIIFSNLVNMSITASYIIIAVIFTRFCFQKFPKRYSYLLWSVVGIRLLCPVSFSSVISIFNLKFFKNANTTSGRTMEYIPTAAAYTGQSSSRITSSGASTDAMGIAHADPGRYLNLIILVAAYVWMIGMVLILAYGIFSYFKLKKRVRTAVRLENHVFESDKIPSPFVMGVMCPKIYIPFRLKEEEQNYILEHERYHIKRKDPLVKLLAFVLTTIYWFNPLIWVAYYLMSQDMEMSCDEAVLAQYNGSMREEYSMSLLSFATNQRLHFPSPLAFSESNTGKRIRNVFKEKRTGLWVTICAVVMILVICVLFLTNGKKADSGNVIWSPDGMASEETGATSIVYEYSLEEIPENYLFYIEIFYGDKLVDVHELSSGQFGEEKQGAFTINNGTNRNESGTVNALTMGITMGPHSEFKVFDVLEEENYTSAITDSLWDDTEENSFEVDRDYVIQTTYLAKSERSTIEALDCEFWNELSEVQKGQYLKKNDMTIFIHLVTGKDLDVLRDKYIKSVRDSMEILLADAEVYSSEMIEEQQKLQDEKTALDAQLSVQKWAEAFCNRDGAAIRAMSSAEVEQQLIDQELLEKNQDSFGYSSPWPWDAEADSMIYSNTGFEDKTGEAVIYYYAETSDPHLAVWMETITYQLDGSTFTVEKEELRYLDQISNTEDFYKAYISGISNTRMDYSRNDLGKTLNNNAMLSSSSYYKGLFEPDTAAGILLNISEEAVTYEIENNAQQSDGVNVTIYFKQDNGNVTIRMIQPFGTEGIWVPDIITVNN